MKKYFVWFTIWPIKFQPLASFSLGRRQGILVPDDEDEHGQEDEVKAAEAVLEGHESELGLDAAQVDLDDVHVRGVEN